MGIKFYGFFFFFFGFDLILGLLLFVIFVVGS